VNNVPNTTAVTTLRDLVLQRVKLEIVSGHSTDRTVYTVPSLATELGVSTTPVREALLELSRNGFLMPMRNRGFRVKALSVDDLNDIFAVREVLESFAMTSVASTRIFDIDHLNKLADEVAAAVKRKDNLGYLEKDRAFHIALVSHAKNPTLTNMIMSLRDQMRWHGVDSIAGRQCQVSSVKQHYELVDLAARGKKTEVAVLITRHIHEWRVLFEAVLNERQRREDLAARGNEKRLSPGLLHNDLGSLCSK
jgi:DNA-binding GntR family transcriptional regulator